MLFLNKLRSIGHRITIFFYF